MVRAIVLCLLLASVCPSQLPSRDEDMKLPNGKSQREEILRSDHERSLRDIAKLIELSETVKADLEKNDRHVLSIGSLKRLEDIEKLARDMRKRMKRY